MDIFGHHQMIATEVIVRPRYGVSVSSLAGPGWVESIHFVQSGPSSWTNVVQLAGYTPSDFVLTESRPADVDKLGSFWVRYTTTTPEVDQSERVADLERRLSSLRENHDDLLDDVYRAKREMQAQQWYDLAHERELRYIVELFDRDLSGPLRRAMPEWTRDA